MVARSGVCVCAASVRVRVCVRVRVRVCSGGTLPLMPLKRSRLPAGLHLASRNETKVTAAFMKNFGGDNPRFNAGGTQVRGWARTTYMHTALLHVKKFPSCSGDQTFRTPSTGLS